MKALSHAIAALLVLSAWPVSAQSPFVPLSEGAATPALPTPAPASAASGEFQSNLSNPEFVRGMWVDALGPALRSADTIKKLVKDCRDSGFNAVFAQIRVGGDALYETKLVPRFLAIPADLDPLKTLIAEARGGDKPLQVYAVFVTFRAWTLDAGPVPAGHVAANHPDWLTESEDGSTSVGDEKNELWLDPGVTEVQDHLADVVADLVRNYDVDGVVLDRLRYPEVSQKIGYSKAAVERFNKEKNKTGKPAAGDADWVAWRRDQVSASLRKMREAVRTAKPKTKVMVATITFDKPPASVEEFRDKSEPCARAMQDWVAWCAEGLIDVNVLMDLKTATSHAADYDGWMNFAVENKGKAKVLVVVGGFLNPPKYTLAMMLQPIFNPKADGVALYSYHAPALAPTGSEAAFAVLKKGLDPASVHAKGRELAPLATGTQAGAPLTRYDQISMQLTGAPEAASTQLAQPATPPAPAATPDASLPKLSSAGVTAPAAPGLPSLNALAGQPSAAPPAASVPGAGLPSLGSLGAQPPAAAAASASLPSLGSVGTQPPAAAAPSASLPSLGSLGTQPAATAPSASLPSLGTAAAVPPTLGEAPAAIQTSLPPLPGAVSAQPAAPGAPLPGLSSVTAPAATPEAPPTTLSTGPVAPAAPGQTSPFAGLEGAVATPAPVEPAPGTVGRTAVGLPSLEQGTVPKVLPESPKMTDTAVETGTLPPMTTGAPPAATVSPFDAAAGQKAAAIGLPAETPRQSVSIPDYGPSSNYSGQPIAGPPLAVPTMTPPSVLGFTGQPPTSMEATTPQPMASPQQLVSDLSEKAGAYIGTGPTSGLRQYGPQTGRKPLNPAAVAPPTGPFDTIVMHNGKQFSGRVLEQGEKWKIQLANGSVLSLPREKVTSVQKSGGSQ